MRSSLRWCVLGAVTGLVGCAGQEKACEAVSFPAPPSDASQTLFVASPCNGEIADGSRERPFSLINDAIPMADAGTVILVASETEYAEDVLIDRAVRLIGTPPGSLPAEATATIRPTTSAGITVAPGVTGADVRGLVIERGKGAGIWAQSKAHATFAGMNVSKTETDGDGEFGYGVLVTDDASVTITDTDILDARNVGVLVSGGEVTMDNVHVSGVLEHGGIRLEGATGDSKLTGVFVDACTEVGILVSNSKATIKDATVIHISRGDSGIGDGIVVRRRKNKAGEYDRGAQADIDNALVVESARVGVLFSEGAIGSLTNSAIDRNGVDPIWSAGVWLQSGAGGDMGVLVQRNKIRENKFNGIGLTSGAFARILNNDQIVNNKPDSLFDDVPDGAMLGQGLALLGGARAQIEFNGILSNGLYGVLMDNPAAGTTITDNEINFNGAFGLVVQHAANGIPPFAKNTFDGNAFAPTQIFGEAEEGVPFQDADFPTP